MLLENRRERDFQKMKKQTSTATLLVLATSLSPVHQWCDSWYLCMQLTYLLTCSNFVTWYVHQITQKNYYALIFLQKRSMYFTLNLFGKVYIIVYVVHVHVCVCIYVYPISIVLYNIITIILLLFLSVCIKKVCLSCTEICIPFIIL